MKKSKVNSIFIYSYSNLNISDLRKLFELINRVDRANEPIQKDLETYAYNVGIHEIDRKKQKAINVNFIC
jgi:hypothetical protein